LKCRHAIATALDGAFMTQSAASENEFRSPIHSLQGVASLAGAALVTLAHHGRRLDRSYRGVHAGV